MKDKWENWLNLKHTLNNVRYVFLNGRWDLPKYRSTWNVNPVRDPRLLLATARNLWSAIGAKRTSPLRVALVATGRLSGPLFTKRTDVLRQDLAKSWDSGLNLSHCSEIWLAPRQHRCRDACQILERYDHYNNQSRGFETSRDLAIRRLTA